LSPRRVRMEVHRAARRNGHRQQTRQKKRPTGRDALHCRICSQRSHQSSNSSGKKGADGHTSKVGRQNYGRGMGRVSDEKSDLTCPRDFEDERSSTGEKQNGEKTSDRDPIEPRVSRIDVIHFDTSRRSIHRESISWFRASRNRPVTFRSSAPCECAFSLRGRPCPFVQIKKNR